MNCVEAHEAILEAEPAALRGEGDGALARHLVECAACRERARRVLSGMAALDRALEAEAGASPVRRKPPARHPIARRLAPWGAGLAAAAALAGLLLVRHPDAPRGTGVTAVTRLAAGMEVDLSASTRPAAVFRTADPNITVVWFF